MDFSQGILGWPRDRRTHGTLAVPTGRRVAAALPEVLDQLLAFSLYISVGMDNWVEADCRLFESEGSASVRRATAKSNAAAGRRVQVRSRFFSLPCNLVHIRRCEVEAGTRSNRPRYYQQASNTATPQQRDANTANTTTSRCNPSQR